MRTPRTAVALIVLAELLGTAVWFSINAVADGLARDWGMTLAGIGHLTIATQSGFIAGTLLFALSGLADRYSASRIFALCAVAAALANGAFLGAQGHPLLALALRFAVGLALAGVYPIGMKLIVSWAPQKVSHVIGWLVGMLTVGTGLPHLIRALSLTPDWHFVILAASALAILAALLIWRLGDGPHHGARQRIHWGGVFANFLRPDFRAAAFGYFGHMWELYAFWLLVPLLVALATGASPHAVSLLSFAVFAVGGVGCIVGGMLTPRWGNRRIAAFALAGSGLLCLIYPLASGLGATALLSLLMLWGILVVTDSPQFSSLAATAARRENIGSALALMNSIGFAISMVSIELAAAQWPAIGVHIAWLLLPGPVLGLIALKQNR